MDPRRLHRTLFSLALLLALAAPAAGHGLQQDSGGNFQPVRQGLRLLTRCIRVGDPAHSPHPAVIFGTRG